MVVLEASIQNVGPQYVLNLVSTDCRTGEVIDRQQVQAIREGRHPGSHRRDDQPVQETRG